MDQVEMSTVEIDTVEMNAVAMPPTLLQKAQLDTEHPAPVSMEVKPSLTMEPEATATENPVPASRESEPPLTTGEAAQYEAIIEKKDAFLAIAKTHLSRGQAQEKLLQQALAREKTKSHGLEKELAAAHVENARLRKTPADPNGEPAAVGSNGHAVPRIQVKPILKVPESKNEADIDAEAGFSSASSYIRR